MSTDFLFSMPSFLTGAGRVFDLAGQMTRYNTSATPEAADIDALTRDLACVGNDLGPDFEVVSSHGAEATSEHS